MLKRPPLLVLYISRSIFHVRRRDYLTFDFTDMKISCHVFQFLGSCHVHSFELICILMSGYTCLGKIIYDWIHMARYLVFYSSSKQLWC